LHSVKPFLQVNPQVPLPAQAGSALATVVVQTLPQVPQLLTLRATQLLPGQQIGVFPLQSGVHTGAAAVVVVA
jgi:hypothetical protein